MIPIVPGTYQPRSRPSLEARLERTLAKVRAERPELELSEEFKAFVPESLHRGPTLHLDDQSGIQMRGVPYEWSYIQDRARLRAQNGDFVAASLPPPSGYEAYCQDDLGLGDVAWLIPGQKRNRSNLATHCWSDRKVRHELVRSMRDNDLEYIHPLMGSRDVWELAHLLHHSAHRPIKVIAPPPAVARWVNDKIEFARLIHHLFGERWLPPTRACSSLSALSKLVRDLAERYEVLGVKVPDAAGGRGNVVIPAARVRGRSLRSIHAELRTLVRKAGWRGERHLLVGAWETDVLSAPSAQLWIPPDAPPVVEGVFEQILQGVKGEFIGTHPSDLPSWVMEQIVERSWLVAQLFQQLGYIGRCSFDFVLVGSQVDRSRLEFIECNGRWGGTSLPMTLVNRLMPVGAERHYVVRALNLPANTRVAFADLLAHLDDLLFRLRTGRGRLVLFNPLRAVHRRDLSVLAFGATTADAQAFIEEVVEERLRSLPLQRGAQIA